MSIKAKAFLCSVALSLGNYIWQAMTTLDWYVAAERSFFQIMAIMIFVFIFKLEESPDEQR